MAMDMTLVDKWEFLWHCKNVLWPAPTCGNGQEDHLEPEPEPEPEPKPQLELDELEPEPVRPEHKLDPEVAVDCASSNDGGEKSSGYLKSMEEQQQQGQKKQQDQSLGLFERRHRRSVSDDMKLDTSRLFTARKGVSSPFDIIEKAALQPFMTKEAHIKDLKTAKLATIASGKEFKEPSQAKMVPKIQQTAPRLKERKRGTKSLTDLEFDEVKGFSELGFTFSAEDLTPRVVQVLPGLQRLSKQGAACESYLKVSRPYPSEDWLMRRPDPPVRKLQMPALRMQGVDMKENLKFWAHAVASTVKMEC
ncbi:hypothetical protein SUGI_0243950 [Cryptomeria japonica]|uniref:uncharacterized protein LOC131034294 n=1 Tax=Cryptomeria japonica TaxID=3369 RepID=UPI002408E86D|nr:uncharacterized protein LOC131034294 [Cryptomeria japonica]GLJ14949.1 hypothetical protein SUGI_0243950 [Cryptomeria japonica]